MKDFKETLVENESTIKEYLIETAKWMRFLSIIGMIGEVLILGVGIVLLFLNRGDMNGLPSFWTGIIYIVVGVIMLFPLLYMYNCSQSITRAYERSEMECLLSAVKYNKQLWKFYGLFVLVYLAIIILVSVSALFVACLR